MTTDLVEELIWNLELVEIALKDAKDLCRSIGSQVKDVRGNIGDMQASVAEALGRLERMSVNDKTA